MKIISTNIAQPKTIIWNGKEVKTGIYKEPVDRPIYLGTNHVKDDEVSDRKVHGGEYKACYLFSADHYPYWQQHFPKLNWKYGMLGENLTVEGLDEQHLIIGNQYKIGNALVEITQPREPCYKFGVKFGTQEVLKQFIEHGFPGTYVRVLQEGSVKNGDRFQLVEKAKNSISIHQFFQLLYSKDKNKNHIKAIINNEAIPIRKRNRLKVFL